MKITRAKSFEDKDGNWQKFEIELTDDDLIPMELEANPAVQFTLLEIKAEQCLNAFLLRIGELDEDKAIETSNMLQEFRKSLLETPTLKLRNRDNKS